VLPEATAQWPRVEIVLNHVGADGRLVDALLAQGVDGLVVAGTGNGTVSVRLQQALQRAVDSGVRLRWASRCAVGPVAPAGLPRPADDELELSAAQARVALLLKLLAERTVPTACPA
jgi:L-asparaginase